MKQPKLRLLIYCIFLFFIVINVCAQDYPIKIIMTDFPPYNYLENNKIVGFATDVIRAIMIELNVNYGIQEYPDARMHHMLEEDKGIMAYVLFRTPSRENKYKWIGPIATDHVDIYKNKGSNLIINNINDAKKVTRISAYHEGAIFDRLEELGFKNIDKTPNVDGIFKKLLNGRVDLMVGLPNLGVKHWLRNNGYAPDDLVQLPVRVESFDMYIVCTKDIPDSIINKWQKSLDGLKASGGFEKLYNKYN